MRFNITNLPERESEESLEKNVVSVFNNDLSGEYGANHNKFAVIGHKGADGKFKVSLMNGSANWSAMAMQQTTRTSSSQTTSTPRASTCAR